MKRSEFEKLVEKALMDLPEHIRKEIDNAAVVIERKSPQRGGSSLLGLYEGVPKTSWGRNFGQILPDKITIFQEPIEKLASSNEEIIKIVRDTVWHEIAHHFGFSEKQTRVLEKKWQNRKK